MFRVTNSSILRSTFWLYIQLFDCIYSVAADRCHGWDGTEFHLNLDTGRQQCRCIVPKAVYTVKKCSWGWANVPPETCRADLKRLINEKIVASCWLLTSLQPAYSHATLVATYHSKCYHIPWEYSLNACPTHLLSHNFKDVQNKQKARLKTCVSSYSSYSISTLKSNQFSKSWSERRSSMR